MNKIHFSVYLILLIGCVISMPARSESLQSLYDIEQAAYVYALSQAEKKYDNPQISMAGLDSRLRLQQCSSELNAFSKVIRSGLGNQTIGVKCYAPTAWTVYVPVKVKVFKPVIVATKRLLAKQIVTKSDIRIEQKDIGTLYRGHASDMTLFIGQQLKYSIAMGTVIDPQSLLERKLVHRGEHIILIAKAGAMEVRMSGKALADAKRGQRVRVRNLSSKRIVEGVVDGPGIVRVTM
ncbi:MAG: flagellar basal body P-ring formation protein FlgA [Piscirickettsiaceae bacterium]|nr:flagellar basal body P-ring formation protein FlgA [Piscirickettsiaceae bacterium]